MRQYTFFIEIFVFYILVCLLNFFLFPHLLGFLDVDPHPFWLGILLFGFRYGVTAGFLSGLISAVLYLMAAWASGEQYRFEELNFYVLPSFFMVFGLLIGTFTARSREEIGGLKKENKQIQKNVDLLKGEIQTIQEVSRGLEKKVVTRMSTLITLYQGAKKLEGTHLEDLYPSIVEFVAKTLEAEEASLYLKVEKGWKLAHKFGWKDFHSRPLQLGPTEGLIGLAGSGKKILSIRDFIKNEKGSKIIPKFMGDSVLAGPIKSGEKGEVIGVISIQKMPFYNFNSATMNLFSFLLNWATRSVEHALYIQALREQEVIDPELQVYSYKYFERRMHQEFLRSKTYYLPLSVGVIQVPQLEYLEKNQKRNFLLLLSQLLKESVREMDVVARFQGENAPFAVLWVTANKDQAAVLKDKILNNFQKIDFEKIAANLKIKVGLSSFTPKVTGSDMLINLARENLYSSERKKT
jgi:polysaccharide biosynthesis protein PelD